MERNHNESTDLAQCNCSNYKSGMSSNKPIVNAIAELASKKGMRHAIISSGSRNAPIVISLHAQKKIECLSIIDERSAGFFALGIAQQVGSPVGLVCTSGSAVLNYAPAI